MAVNQAANPVSPPLARKLRVLFVGTHLLPTAGNRSVGEGLADGLARSGFQVTLTSRVRSRPLRVLDMLVTAWRCRDNYDVAQVDVYSGAAFRWAEWVARVIRAARKPYILTLHGGNLPEFAKRNPVRVARLLGSAAAVTAPSEYLADAMRLVRSDVRILPNPLDLDLYVYRERTLLKPRLVWLRAFHRIYNPVLAVRVLAEVTAHTSDVRLTMIGPDKDGSAADVRAEARKLGVLSQIVFTGGIAKSDVPRWLTAGDIFLNTTTIDNAPVSIIEAMAIGLPIVSTNVGGIPYLVEDGRNGILVPANDAKAMARAVIRLLNEPSLATIISRNARAKAETFGWDSVLPQWERLLLEVTRRETS